MIGFSFGGLEVVARVVMVSDLILLGIHRWIRTDALIPNVGDQRWVITNEQLL